MKRYKSSNFASTKAAEPSVAYGTYPQIITLCEISSRDMGEVDFPGSLLSRIQEETDLHSLVFAGILGVSKSKYYELTKHDLLEVKEIDALADFANLWMKGLEAFDGDQSQLKDWLNTPNINLGGVKPISLLSSRLGRRELEKAFLRIEYSVYG